MMNKISLLRSSGGYESGSIDTEEQLSPDLTPQIIGFPTMLKVLEEIFGNGPLKLLNERSTRARPLMAANESGRTPDKLLLFNFL
jgi:hypothetical protein